MAKTLANQRTYSDVTSGVWIAPLGTAYPATPLPTAWGAGWLELGLLTDKGVIENMARQKTKTWNWQGGSAGRSLYTQPEHSFQIECNEENSHVLRLARPGSTVVATGGSAEVQTVTLTGGPGSAGTWTLTLPGYGTAAGLAYNITMAALQTALSAAYGLTMPLPTGTAGASYVISFPATAGNLPTQTATNNITGVTSITVAETTPGVNPTNTTQVKAYTGSDYWMFGIDLVDSNLIHKRYIVPQGDATLTGTVSYAGTGLTVYAFTIDCYPDTTGTLFLDVNDNPALSATT